jgi:prepilin-type N-terminal cleavage/methylation domain-containing protein
MKKTHDVKHPRPIRKSGERGFTLLELLIVTGILLVIVAIAVPSYLSAKRSSNGSAAASSVEGYNKAVQSYANEFQVIPAGGTNMVGAEVSPPTPACATGGELTTNDGNALAAGLTRSGYLFTYKSSGTAAGLGGCAGGASYDLIGTPSVPGSTGISSFCWDQTGGYTLATPTAQAGPAGGVSCGADGFTERVGS